MELPVVIEALPDKRGFIAHLGGAFALSAEALTAEEAHRQLTRLLQARIEQGLELRTINLPVDVQGGPKPGWLPNDQLTHDWLQQVQHYRSECDVADRQRLLSESKTGEAAPCDAR